MKPQSTPAATLPANATPAVDRPPRCVRWTELLSVLGLAVVIAGGIGTYVLNQHSSRTHSDIKQSNDRIGRVEGRTAEEFRKLRSDLRAINDKLDRLLQR